MAFLLKGIGDSVTGQNEIVPSFDAKIFNFISATEPCVVSSETDRFNITLQDRAVTIGSGMAFAYGYFGMSDSNTKLNFVTPSSANQYAKVYAEFNLSSTPQTFSIKSTPQSNSSVIDLTQDNLNQTPSGIYQLPLYLLTLYTNGTVGMQDLRVLKSTIGEIELSNKTNNPILDTYKRDYLPLKYNSEGLITSVSGNNGQVPTQISSRFRLWRSPTWYGIGTKIPGNGSPKYLEIEFDETQPYSEIKCLELVISYSASLPDSLIKIPTPADDSTLYTGGHIHIFVNTFVSPSGQMNILCYPLGTLTNWSSGDECGSGSALFIANRYPVDQKYGLFLQYIERVGNTNQAQSECALIEVYGII